MLNLSPTVVCQSVFLINCHVFISTLLCHTCLTLMAFIFSPLYLIKRMRICYFCYVVMFPVWSLRWHCWYSVTFFNDIEWRRRDCQFIFCMYYMFERLDDSVCLRFHMIWPFSFRSGWTIAVFLLPSLPDYTTTNLQFFYFIVTIINFVVLIQDLTSSLFFFPSYIPFLITFHF